MGCGPQMNFATKIMGGNTNNKADSAGRRLGIKKWGHNDEVFPGDILVRQRGYKWQPGTHVYGTRDHTLHSSVEVSQNTFNSFNLGFPCMVKRPLHFLPSQTSTHNSDGNAE
jgi:large subunit ribosomal protein L27